MSTIPLTVAGAEALRKELHEMKTIHRPAVIAAIAEARSHGDLSENAEYDAAKEKQGFIEGRIAELESKLSSAQIINPALINADGACVFLVPPWNWKICKAVKQSFIKSLVMMKLISRMEKFPSALPFHAR